MITAWRICARQHIRAAFSGEGAAANGGRWNSLGTRIVYTAGSQALAALEILVNTADPNDLVDLGFVAIPVQIDIAMIAEASRLPRGWKSYPAPLSTMRYGDRWARSMGSLALRVPSVVIPSEWNYLLNPLHPDFRKVLIGKPVSFNFDRRLIAGRPPRKGHQPRP